MSDRHREIRLLEGIYWMLRGMVVASLFGFAALISAALTDNEAVAIVLALVGITYLVISLLRSSGVGTLGDTAPTYAYDKIAESEPPIDENAVPFDQFIRQQDPDPD